MNVLLVINSVTFGGSERVMVNLANYLCKNHKVTLVGLSPSKNTKVYDIDNTVEFIDGIKNGNHPVKGMISLRSVIKNVHPEIILSFTTHINIATIISAMGLRIPVVVSERCDPSYTPASKVRRILRRIFYPFAKGYVFQTDKARAFFKGKINRISEVIPNPLFLDKEIVPFEERRKEIVCVARMRPHKGQDLVLEAFRRISANYPEYTLHFYGDGDNMENVMKKAKASGVNEKVYFHGSVSDVLDREKYAEIFMFASQVEGMPNALMEAMGLGLTCISTKFSGGGAEFLINSGENGLLVPVNDTDALTEALSEVLENPDYSKTLAENAYNIRKTLSVGEIFKKWEEYLKSKA